MYRVMTTKGKFLEKFNEAYANKDKAYIFQNITDDIIWDMVGDRIIHGKEEFIKHWEVMETASTYALEIKNIITHGTMGVVDGNMKMTDPSGKARTFAFCDVYKFSGFKNPKIKEMASYVIEV